MNHESSLDPSPNSQVNDRLVDILNQPHLSPLMADHLMRLDHAHDLHQCNPHFLLEDGNFPKANTSENEGMCIECTDQPFVGFCTECQDYYCLVCYQVLHRRGSRSLHHFQLISSPSAIPLTSNSEIKDSLNIEKQDFTDHSLSSSVPPQSSNWFLNRAMYIPLRLNYDERKMLRLLEATLNISDYTDVIDVYCADNRSNRIFKEIKKICSILSGLVFALDYERGQTLLKDRNYAENAAFFQRIFEIGRRYKINNPEKMRSDYGKLIYLLQDINSPPLQELLEFDCVIPLNTVYRYLDDRDALALLKDKRMTVATNDVIPDGKSRFQLSQEVSRKEEAREYLANAYSSPKISPDEIKWCLYSLGDSQSFLMANRDPCDKMMSYLKEYFNPERDLDPLYSLSIQSGKNGARLSHSHARQYHYVLQSLTLWREVLNDMFMLWHFVEQDMLDPKIRYRLCNTGQGLNRKQPSPRVYRAIVEILHRVQSTSGDWIGSSVIHLGDHNVPNPLFFITKYLSVSPILNPIILCLQGMNSLTKKPHLAMYLDSEGGVEHLKKIILSDFFKHAFDGSGADSFFDAGSCIDGRFTSAWNWCNQIEKKSFFSIFLLTGFVGFDAEF